MIETPAAREKLLRSKWLIAIYGIFGLAVFVTYIAASFPYSDALSSILAPYQMKLVYDSQRLSPPVGARLEDVRLLSTVGPSPQLLLRSPGVTLAPALGSLLLGRPAIRVSADLYGGLVDVTVYQRAGATNLSFVLNGVSLAESAPLQQLGTKLSGSVSGAGSAELNGMLLSGDRGHMTLDGHDVVVEIVDGAPPIRLGTVSGMLSLEDGVLTMRDVEAHSGDLELRAEGTIRLDQEVAESYLEMRLSLVPTASGREHFGIFLKLLPHPPEEGPYQVSGPLMSPNIS
jgi:type II secretion system protein N